MLKDSVVSELSNLYFLLDAYFSRKSIMIQNNPPVRASSGAGSTDVAGNSRLHFFQTRKSHFLDRLNPAGHGDFADF